MKVGTPWAARSAGWWLLDEEPYYSEGNFMTYKNGVQRYIDETQASSATHFQLSSWYACPVRLHA